MSAHPSNVRVRREGDRPAWAAPLLTLGATAAVTLIVAFRSPEEPGQYPACPFYALTDQWCPGCGSMRVVHALTHGDLGTAIDRNVLTVAAVPIALMAWGIWLVHRLRPRPRSGAGFPGSLVWYSMTLVIAFTVLRNTDIGSWLAP